MADYERLKAELRGDPLGRGYVGMSDEQAAASLNAVDRDQAGDVPVKAVEGYLRSRMLVYGLSKFLASPPDGTPDLAVGAAYELLGTIASPRLDAFAMSDPAENARVTAMLTALVGAGVLSAGNEADLLAMAVTKVSRASQLGWPEGVSAGNVDSARNNYP